MKSMIRKVAMMASLSVVALVALPALAGGGGPPTLPAIEFPIDIASVVVAIVAAGAAILVLTIGPKTGFALVKAFVSKLISAVRR